MKTETVWEKWECDKGKRWTTVKGSFTGNGEKEGGLCYFSGCKENDHYIHFKGYANREEGGSWFRH